MSWLERCYQTYEYIRRAEPDLIGRQEPNRATLLPVGHTTQQAQIQVYQARVDSDGRMYAQVCGGADGKIAIVTIPQSQQKQAAALGFQPYSQIR